MSDPRLVNDRYALIEPIAQGVMGPVYRGVDNLSGAHVAVKILHSDVFEQQPDLLARFEQEGAALRQVNHPNIVHFSDFYEEDGTYYLIMEYVEGGSLHDLLKGERVPLERVLEIGLDLADALARAHRLGIIHRDVKPQNILLAADGTPRLSDFGLAYFMLREPLSSLSAPAGTLYYMPPESFQGRPADERTDIWSLGVVLFEMLTGRLPFTAENAGELIHLITNEQSPDLCHEQPELPAALCALVDLMLAKQPDDRIGSVRLVGAALEAIRNGREAMLPHLADARPYGLDVGNLPEPATSFIGRKQALAEIFSLFSDPGGHLVTLIGPGGVGKTRLALRVAHEMRDSYKDGVFFIDLAPILAPEFVASRIAQTLNVREASGRSVEEDLETFFRGKQCLLLLDNFEQVIQAASVVSNLNSSVPGLDILITSRESLRLSSERVYPVQPLALPDLSRDPSPMALSAAESVDLFVQRAEAAQAGFRLTAANAADIAEICVQLDGLPLAIELAAARTRVLPPRFLRKELSDVFSALADGPRDSVARQQTLRAAVDWSYDLLSDQDKLLFDRLSLFQGGATLKAIDAVCMPGLSISMVSGLESLISKSLLLRRDDSDTEPRFEYLKTIHQYAIQRLREREEAAAMHRRHAEFYIALVEELVPQLKGPEQEFSLRDIRKDNDNLRAVLTWSLDGQEPLLGLRLVATLADFWYYEGSAVEGERWTQKAIRWIETAPRSLQARLLNGAGLLAFNRGDHKQGTNWNQQALAIARMINDKASAAWALFWLSAHATDSPANYEHGITLCQNALELFREIDDRYGLAWGYNQIGELSRMLGKYEQAREAYLQSLAVCRRTGNIRREAIALVNLGYVAQHQQAYAEAEAYMLEGLALLYRLKLVHYSAISLATLSGPLAALGAERRAVTLLGASDAIFTRMAIPQQPADKMEIERYTRHLREQLDEAEFSEAWAEGQAMSIDDAVAFAFLRHTG